VRHRASTTRSRNNNRRR